MTQRSTSPKGSKKKLKDFHNTVEEDGQTLIDLKARAASLQQRIYLFFRQNPDKAFTPHEVNQALPGTLITSVRRAMTNLAEADWLIKTNEKVMEQHGVNNFKWKFNIHKSVG